jgi:transposase
MADRRELVVRFADAHGPRAAARHFGVKLGTVKGWQGRARKRAKVHTGRQTPVARFEQAARELLERALAGTCLRCGGSGHVTVNTRERQAAVPAVAGYQYARRLTCPDCGAPRRSTVVVSANLRMALAAAAADRQATREQEGRGDLGHREAWR